MLLGHFARFEYNISDLWTMVLGNNPCGQMRFLIIYILKLQNPWSYVVSTSVVCVVGSVIVEKYIIKRINILGTLLLGSKGRI